MMPTAKVERTAVFLAARYINHGAECYEKARIQEAAAAFADALTMSKHIIDSDQEYTSHSDHVFDQQGPFHPEFGNSERFLPATNDVSIFLNPIRVPEKLPNTKVSKTFTLIAMFNLAICNHRTAMIRNMDSSYLQTALQLYELAYAIQMQEGIDMTLTPTMIIMSNVGHIHKILGNDDNALLCFQHLLSTLMFLVEAGERERVWEFDGFFNNVLKTVYSNSPAAAA